MPRDASGNYTLPAGNPVITGTPIETAWANPTLGDVATEMTNSLDRNGRGGMLAPFRFADGLVGAPSLTFTSEPTSGIFRAGASDFRAVVGGVARMRWTASGVDIWDGAGWTAVMTAAGTVTITGAQTITGAKTFQNNDADILSLYRSSTTLGPRILFRNTDGPKGYLFIDDSSNFTFADFAGTSRFTINSGGTVTAGTVPYARLSDMAANVMLLTGAQIAAGTKTFNAFTWVTQPGSSGNNAARELFGFSDDRTDMYSSIGTWRGASSQRVGLSFFTSYDLAPVETMRLNELGNLSVLAGTFFSNSTIFANTTIELGHASDTTLARIAAGRVSIEGNEIATLSQAQTFTGGKEFSVPAEFADGSVGAPGITFSADTNTGLYRIGTDNMAIVTGSVARARFNSATGGRTTGMLLFHADGSSYDAGFNVMPPRVLDAAITFAATDVGKILRKTSVTARTWTTPASTDTTIPIGAVINLQNGGSGAITIAAGAGVVLSWYTGATVTAGSRTLGIGGVATLYRLDADSWQIWGNGGLT